MNESGAPSSRVVVQLEEFDDHGDVIDALALAEFATGAQPFSRRVELHRVRAEATLLPRGVEPERWADVQGTVTSLARGEGWTLHTLRSRDRSASVTVWGATRAIVESTLEQVTAGAVEPEPPPDEAVTIGFWHLATGCRPVRRPRAVDVMPWATISRNYSRRVARAVSRLMALDPETLTGRVVLLHGAPGTGKTTALRALAHAWGGWCKVEYILDPERLLADPGYLMAVALGAEDDDVDTWRLLILEDCDELVQADAKHRTGQSLARLLNLTDGLLGHGLKLLVGITTNEPLARLHPAVVRPGRCVAEIEVGRLSPAEARAWLGRPAPIDAAGATLAELFALRGELTTVEEREPAAAGGMYL